MEDSITKYLTLYQTPEFVVRATLYEMNFYIPLENTLMLCEVQVIKCNVMH